MAPWQFGLDAAPLDVVAASGVTAIYIAAKRKSALRLDITGQELAHISIIFADAYGDTKLSSPGSDLWGELHGNHAEIFGLGEGSISIRIGIDVSNIDSGITRLICHMAYDHGWVFVDDSGLVIPPISSAVVKAAALSSAGKFLRGPDGYLRQLAIRTLIDQ